MQTAQHTGETPGTTDDVSHSENSTGCVFCSAPAVGFDAETQAKTCRDCAGRPLGERVDEQAVVAFDIEPSQTGDALFSIRQLYLGDDREVDA